LLHSTHLPKGGVTRVVPRGPGSNVVGNQTLQVVLQFLGELLFNAAAPKQRTKAQAKLFGPAHDRRLSSSRFNDQRDRRGQPFPVCGAGLQRLATSRGELVVLRATIVLASGPLGLDPPLLLEFVERGVQRALAHPQLLVRHLSNPLRNRPAVHRFQGQNTEKKEIKCALHEVCWLAHSDLSVTEWRVAPVGLRSKGRMISTAPCRSALFQSSALPLQYVGLCSALLTHKNVSECLGLRLGPGRPIPIDLGPMWTRSVQAIRISTPSSDPRVTHDGRG